MQKKLFKHGGSYAVDLPVSFVRDLPSKTVVVEKDREKIVIVPKRELDNIEQEPEFGAFVAALLHDAMKRPAKLRGVKDVWDKEWDELLKGVPGGKD
ncbi:MAG: hypothetical protein A3G41_04100 [Elusimicrobia bacterium RIFCSPLOWO2_12_FULL_59_9]|nr:MAG: hypothetical protein A3G41_04100 [Elusimicrobia bacterium RIFCSPLOWO2_12_FULL_59_9]